MNKILGGGLLLVAVAAAAQEDVVVITATRLPQPSLEIPASVDRLYADEIREGRPQVNLSESMGRVPGIVVQDRGNYAQDFRVQSRGFGARAAFGVRGIRLIADGIGFSALTTQDLWKDHVEKVCAFTAEFADKNPKTVKACLKALHEASVWLDDMNNRPEQCEIVSRPTYINCDMEIILGRLLGKLDYGDGRSKTDDLPMHYSKRNCNYPQPAYAKWWLTQFRRWGMVTGAPDYEGIARQVMRPDIYEEAMKELGYPHGGRDDSSWTMSDNVTFDPKGDLEAYAKGFAVNNLKG